MTLRILNKFFIGITLTSITLTSWTQANPLSPEIAHEMAMIYQNLLETANPTDTPDHRDLIPQLAPLSVEEILKATYEFEDAIAQTDHSRSIHLLLSLEQLKSRSGLSRADQDLLAEKLAQLDLFTQTELVQLSEQRERAWRFSSALAISSCIVVGAELAVQYCLPHTPYGDPLSWGLSFSLGTVTILAAFHQNQIMKQWTPETQREVFTWNHQKDTFSSKIKKKLIEKIEIQTHAHLPYQELLLNWASKQEPLRSLEETPLIMDDLPSSSREEIAIEIPAEAAPTLNSRINDLKGRFAKGSLSASDLKHFPPSHLSLAFRALSQEMNQAPHAFYTHFLTQKLAFLALRLKNPEALFELLKHRWKPMSHLLNEEYRSFYRRAFDLAVERDYPPLLQLLLKSRFTPRIGPNQNPILDHEQIERAQRIAQTKRFRVTESILLAWQNDRPVLNNAGHSGEGLITLHSTIQSLKKHYLPRIQAHASLHAQEPNRILRLLELRMEELAERNRLSQAEVRAARALLNRIEAPFNPQAPDYDPTHQYQWNTEEKKQTTLELLQIALFALEDRQAFAKLNHRPWTSEERDDNWTSWIQNALVDGAHAYSIDQGTTPPTSTLSGSVSCVAGVDHRIIHGLTGLHPLVRLDGGEQQIENERIWKAKVEALQLASKKEKEARFCNSVFNTLLDLWIQSRAGRLPENHREIILAYQAFVTERAKSELGDSFLISEDFKTLLESVEDFSDQVIEKVNPLTQVTVFENPLRAHIEQQESDLNR